MNAFAQDLRYVLRGLRRAPGFAFVVVLTLALGIGANTAIFSVMDQVLLRPVPYPQGEQVYRLFEIRISGGGRSDVNPGNWLDWQRQSQSMSSMAAWDPSEVALETPAGGERVVTLLVSVEFFPLLGIAPSIGRIFTADDDQPNAPPVAVLAYSTWQQRYGGDPAVLGTRIRLDGRSTEIVGVMPPTFRFVVAGTEFFTPFQLDRSTPWQTTAGRFMSVVARARPGVTHAQAQAEMTTIAEGLRGYALNEGRTVGVVPIRNELVGDNQAPVLAVYGAVVMLLGIAAFNVAGLLLARAVARRGEVATRASIGADRWALMRPLLLESLLLAGLGGVSGIVVAWWTLDVLRLVAPPDVLPIAGLTINGRLLGYAVAVSLVTGIIAGLAPAILLARRTSAGSMRLDARTVTPGGRLRHGLVAVQVALTVVLLCGAGLFSRTVTALGARDTGIQRDGLLTLQVDLPRERYAEEGRRVLFVQQAQERLRQLPGVMAVGAGSSLPVTGSPIGSTSVAVLGQPELPRSERPTAAIRVATPGYFSAIGTMVLRGREFVESDQIENAPLVFVVNQAFVNDVLNGADPLATSLQVNMQRENPYAPIVGVVADTNEGSLWNAARPTVYYNHRQIAFPQMTLFVRAPTPSGLVRPVIEAMRMLDPTVSVADVQPIDLAFRESLARERVIAVASSGFALTGLLLAALGLYGLLAFTVSERTREIGIRMALGAQVGSLLRSVLGRGLGMIAAGAALGAVGAALALRAVEPFLFGVTPYDSMTYAGVLVVLTLVSSVATLAPARRAARLDPVKALRAE